MTSCTTPHTLVPLTDDAGVALTPDDQMAGMYKLPAGGAGDVYFYIAWNAEFAGELIEIDYLVDAAVTLSVDLEMLALGALNWQAMPAHTKNLDAGDAQKLNGNFPLRQIIPHGTYCRIKATVGGACNIGVRVISQ